MFLNSYFISDDMEQSDEPKAITVNAKQTDPVYSQD